MSYTAKDAIDTIERSLKGEVKGQEDSENVCPNCGRRMVSIKCKMVCLGCNYFVGCSE